MRSRDGTRSRAKEEASENAREWKDAAAAAAATGVVALVIPGAQVQAVFFGAAAAFFSAMAARSDGIVADPPRDDFQDTSFPASELGIRVSPAQDFLDPASVQEEFLCRQLVLTASMHGLLRSLERYDGALNAGGVMYAERQAEVMLHHSELAAQQMDRMLLLAPVIDSIAWGLHKDASTFKIGGMTSEEIRAAYSVLFQRSLRDFRRRFPSVCFPGALIPSVEEHPINTSNFGSDDMPSRIFSDNFYRLMREHPKTLRDLVAPEPIS